MEPIRPVESGAQLEGLSLEVMLRGEASNAFLTCQLADSTYQSPAATDTAE